MRTRHLVLVRHGQSLSNQASRFTGWDEVPLSPLGREQAQRAGALLADTGLDFPMAFSSRLGRAMETLELVLEGLSLRPRMVLGLWRLNERHIGALQGLAKADVLARYGQDRLHAWRYGLDEAPPPMDEADPRLPANDQRYADVAPGLLPRGESLADTVERVRPCWRADIAPLLARGDNVLVAGHGISLWALCRLAVAEGGLCPPPFKMPNANPLVIALDERLRPLSVEYLDHADQAELPEPLGALAPAMGQPAHAGRAGG